MRLRWRNAIVKSGGSGSKGLTPYTRLCYRCFALPVAHSKGKAICTSVRPRVGSNINNFYYPDNGYIRIFGI